MLFLSKTQKQFNRLLIKAGKTHETSALANFINLNKKYASNLIEFESVMKKEVRKLKKEGREPAPESIQFMNEIREIYLNSI